MADGGPNQDAVRVEGGQLRVDARDALLVAQLQSSGGEPYVTVRNEGGSLHRAVPSNVRTSTYRLGEDVIVEAVRGSSFVAVEEGGRHLVAAFEGEVVLRAGSAGERLALAPNEGVLVPVGGGEPQVIPLSDAGGDPELASMIDRVTDAMAAPDAASEPAPSPKPEPTTAPVPTPAAPAAAARPPALAPSRQAGKKGKKGKKARQRQAQQQQRPTSPPPKAAAAAAPAAAAATSAAPIPEKADGAEKTAPTKKVAPPRKAQGAAKKRAGGAAPGGGRPPRDGESSNTGRRVLAVFVALAAVLGAVLVLTQTGDNGDTVATDDPTTTAETSSTSETSAPATDTTTSAPATTSTTEAPSTTTTTAKPTTTTTAAPVANYKFEPRTCVQSGNTITYTASLTNQAQSTFDYLVRVRFVDRNGAEVAVANASVNDVRPGQTREVRATGTADRDLRDSGATCAVTAVEPTAS
jgi:hypothetical protein